MFVDMDHHIDFNKVYELAMVVTQHTLQCLYIFIAWNKTRQSEMRPKAQKPKWKGMPYKQNHSLPSLAHTVHCRPYIRSWAAPSKVLGCCVVCSVLLKCPLRQNDMVSRTNKSVEPQETRVDIEQRPPHWLGLMSQAWPGLTCEKLSTSRLVKLVASMCQSSACLECPKVYVAGGGGLYLVLASGTQGLLKSSCNSLSLQQRRQWLHLFTTRVSVNSAELQRVDYRCV